MEWKLLILAATVTLTLLCSSKIAEIQTQQDIQQVQNSPAEVV